MGRRGFNKKKNSKTHPCRFPQIIVTLHVCMLYCIINSKHNALLYSYYISIKFFWSEVKYYSDVLLVWCSIILNVLLFGCSIILLFWCSIVPNVLLFWCSVILTVLLFRCSFILLFWCSIIPNVLLFWCSITLMFYYSECFII